jgi:hypothetical protein
MMSWLFVLIGAAAGGVQAGLLGREARVGPRLWSWPLRLLVVGGVLYLGARAGQLLPAAAGWAAGFLVLGLLAWRRLS